MEGLRITGIVSAIAIICAILLSGCGGGGGGASDSATTFEAASACNPVTGLSSPLPTCTIENPCMRPGMELGVTRIDTPSTTPPLCRTTQAGRPVFDDGPPLQWTDPEGLTRYACLFSPSGASPASQRPLVVWLHGGMGSADGVYNHTLIREKAESYNLTTDPARSGFFLLSVHGRNLHYPTVAKRDGNHHDFYYRDLSSPSQNSDIANVDRLIDELVAAGAVDQRRIYMMGWSNGAFFGQMYAIARQNTPSPGGNVPAAVAVFSGADPFQNTTDVQMPSCEIDPYPTSQLPIFLVSLACDLVACNAEQARGLLSQGEIVAPGYIVQPWLADLRNKVMNTNAVWQIVDVDGQDVSTCTASEFRTLPIATANHVSWPDGFADGSGIDHEPDMLDFLRDNPL